MSQSPKDQGKHAHIEKPVPKYSDNSRETEQKPLPVDPVETIIKDPGDGDSQS